MKCPTVKSLSWSMLKAVITSKSIVVPSRSKLRMISSSIGGVSGEARSTTVAFAIFRSDVLLAEGANTYVAVKRGTTETAPLDPGYVKRILAFEKTSPVRGAKQ